MTIEDDEDEYTRRMSHSNRIMDKNKLANDMLNTIVARSAQLALANRPSQRRSVRFDDQYEEE
jgi:hypothetical protein